jgi:alpha-tubulin suppressor-like RCC1 family protein
MTLPTESCVKKRGVWKLQDIRDKVIAQDLSYNPQGDPGSLWSWGVGSNYGQLGDGTAINRSSPVQIPGSWRCTARSFRHTWAIKSDTTLWGWGSGQYGALGENTSITYSSPIQVPGDQWKCVTTSFFRSMGTKGPGACASYNGTLWKVGRNTSGQGGDDTIVTKSSLVLIPGSNWDTVEAENLHTVALKCDGTLWTWGDGTYGRLGDNTCTPKSSPVQVPGTQWVHISTALRNSYGLKSDGTLWAWGAGFALGANTAINACSPVQVVGNQWVDVRASRYAAMGRKSDNTLWVWGSSTAHDLGICAGGDRSSPVQLPGNQWLKGSFGQYMGAALKTNGTLWVWGTNTTGELGINSCVSVFSPVQLPGIWSDFDLSAGSHILARKSI